MVTLHIKMPPQQKEIQASGKDQREITDGMTTDERKNKEKADSVTKCGLGVLK